MVWDIPQSQAALYIQLSLQSIFSKAFGLAGASQGRVHFALKSCQICYFNSITSFTFIVSHRLYFSLKLCVCELLEG